MLRTQDNAHILEVEETLKRVGADIADYPSYCLMGYIKDERGFLSSGILALASCELHARILYNVLDKYGAVQILKTEWNSETNEINVIDWMAEAASGI